MIVYSTSTLERTLVRGAVRHAGTDAAFHELVDGPGEPHVDRREASGGAPIASLRLGHLTDLHIADAASPLRLDFASAQEWDGAVPYSFRPQELLTTRAVVAAVETLNALDVELVVQTGDAIDSAQENEARSYLSALEGGAVDPLVGTPHRGPLARDWPRSSVWQPEQPDNAYTRRFGLPVLPRLVDAASRSHESAGLAAPWIAVRGNHDVLVLGTSRISADLDEIGRGRAKAIGVDPRVRPGLELFLRDAPAVFRGPTAQIRPEESRRLLEPAEFSAAHRSAASDLLGHGLASSPDAIAHGRYVVDRGDRFRIVAFDTNNTAGMWDGVMRTEQLAWMDDRLAEAERDERLVVLVSHHGSAFLANQYGVCADDAVDAEVVLETLQRRSRVIAWLNGHHHGNQILVHRRRDGSAFAEITTSSVTDWPCQVREVVIDELPTAVRIRTTMHHAAIGARAGLGDDAALARLHHELAANQYWRGAGRAAALGAAHDRNLVIDLPKEGAA